MSNRMKIQSVTSTKKKNMPKSDPAPDSDGQDHPQHLAETPRQCTQLEIEAFVKNDVYDMLMQRFQKKGRGRPPDLPKGLSVTNQLLLQLYFIKGQHYSYADLKNWLEDVEPTITVVSEGRIRHRLDAILTRCNALTSHEQVQQYLSASVDFNALPQPLSSLGLNRLHFLNVVQFDRPPAQNVTNDVVFELEKFRSLTKETNTFVYRWLRRLCTPCSSLSDKQLKCKVHTVICKCKSFSKKQDVQGLCQYLQCVFIQDGTAAESAHSISEPSCGNCSKQANLLVEKGNELRSNVLEKKELITTINELKMELKVKTEIIDVDLPKLRDSNNMLEVTVKNVKNSLKEVRIIKDRLVKENEVLKNSTLYKKNFEYKQSLKDLTNEKACLLKTIENEKEKNDQYEVTISNLKVKVKTEQSLKSQYKSSVAEEKQKRQQLEKMLQFDKEDQEINVKEGGSSHRYSENIRKTFYALQGEGNVPAINCSKVVSLVAQNLINVDLSENQLPCPTTSINFSNEAHVIAKNQIAEEIKNEKHFIYACDGTSRQKATYLEKHIILSNGKQLSLGFSELVTEDSNTLLETCVSALKEIVEIHCIGEEVNQSILFNDLIRKLKALLSDRASVMKSFDDKLSVYKKDILQGEDISTHFLFCNAHFLLALSAACDEAVQSLEEHTILASGKKLGRDENPRFSRFGSVKECATLRLLRTTSNVLGPRGDEKSGCRQNWLAFCHLKERKSLFTSYRSNRFNNLFTNATAVLNHKEDIADFLESFNSHNNSLLDSVLEDLKDSRLITNVAVLSFFHVFLTEPYWQLMNSRKTYADFPPYVKKMKSVLVFWSMDSDAEFNPLNASVVFEDFPASDLHSSVILKFLNSFNCDLLAIKEKLAKISHKCLIALERQLGEFLDGGLFGDEIAESVMEVLKTCPLTNLTGERQFGDLDYCMNTRRNCSLFMRSTRSMWKHNHTAKYLARKSPSVSKKLLDKAIKYGPLYKRKSIEMKKALLERRIEKGNDHRQKKNESDIKKLKSKQAALDAIISSESLVVSTKEELDKIYCGPQPLQRLKEQVRFRNLVGGEKIKITGTKKVLYERLRDHISESSF